jgi:hypothetical protein
MAHLPTPIFAFYATKNGTYIILAMIALYSTKNCIQHSRKLHCPRLRWTLWRIALKTGKNCLMNSRLLCIALYITKKMHPMQTRTLLNTAMDCIVCICQGLHKILPKTSRCGGPVVQHCPWHWRVVYLNVVRRDTEPTEDGHRIL